MRAAPCGTFTDLPSTKISTSSLLEGVEENARAGRENERGLANVENLDLLTAQYGVRLIIFFVLGIGCFQCVNGDSVACKWVAIAKTISLRIQAAMEQSYLLLVVVIELVVYDHPIGASDRM